MKIAITGSNGFVGSALKKALEEKGHSVISINRANHFAAISEIGEFDALVHLAGENVAGFWTKKKKQEIEDSRINGTRAISDFLIQNPPKVFISASAIGCYGDRGDEKLSEESSFSNDFLGNLAKSWEAEANRVKNTRVVNTRFGLILDPSGGALKKMLPAFKFGVAGNLGSGKQYMSWISLEDTIAILIKCLEDNSISGPINVVSPNPIRNSEFTKKLAKALRRPAFFHVPGLVLRLALGEMAEALLLSSARVMPKRLMELGYNFKYPVIDGYFEDKFGTTK